MQMDISSILDKKNIILAMQSKQKSAAFLELAQCFKENNIITDVKGYVEDVLKREAEFSTGIGYGIAIPHAKSKYVKTTAIAVGKLAHNIVYDSIDNEPVRILFMIAVPENGNDAHLKILNKLARKFMDENFRKNILAAENEDLMFEALRIF